MARGIEWLNSLSEVNAQTELQKCCGSAKWAEKMAAARPFERLDDLLRKANDVWWSLALDDWFEAFRSHPRIGEKAMQPAAAEARAWSEQEQSGIRGAAQESMLELAQLNRQYEQKFGYIYILCATGKTSEELRSILRARLGNDPDTELRVAASEQAKITDLRLKKLLNQ